MPLTAARAGADAEPGGPWFWLLGLAVLLAIAAPSLLAYNLPPSATLLNQCVAVSQWGWCLALLMPALAGGSARAAVPLLAALGLLAAAIAGSHVFGSLPAPLALAALALVASAAALVAAGAALRSRPEGAPVFRLFLLALLLSGLLSALIAVVQVYLPGLADGDLIARSGLPGRAVGNLRQPNHLSSLLLWSAVACIALIAMRRVHPASAALVYLLLLAGVVLSGSRTGAVGTLVLAAWGALDRRLGRQARGALLAAPLLYALFWFATAAWAEATNSVFGAEFGAGSSRHDISSSRFGIWSNTLAMIRAQPWLGVGYGEFNFAWTLSPFPGRPTALFDHTHNLPLQLVVELGLPLAGAILLLLAVAFARAWRHSAAVDADDGRAGAEAGLGARAATTMIAMAALHSQLEYPLWYAYFLLPAAFAWGYAIGRPAPPASRSRAGAPTPPALWSLAAGLLMGVGGLLAVLDYQRVVVIFSPPLDAAPLGERVRAGQRSWLFAHHADYAAVTTGEPADAAAQALAWRRAPHNLLDARLMMAWARALAAAGDLDRARWVAARLREFDKPEAQEFFAPCALPAAEAFQCQAPQRAFGWRDFVSR